MATFGNLETTVEPIAGLMREHLLVFDLITAAREAVEQALEDGSGAAAALELSKDLAAFLAEDLPVHMAKEEDVLFPAMRGFAADLDKVVDEMVEQHDEIRMRQSMVERAVAHMDETHDEVREAAAELAARVEGEGSLEDLHDALKRLDWIFQGHFGDEEDDLFPVALELLSSEVMADLARKAAALEV